MGKRSVKNWQREKVARIKDRGLGLEKVCTVSAIVVWNTVGSGTWYMNCYTVPYFVTLGVGLFGTLNYLTFYTAYITLPWAELLSPSV